MMSRGYSIHYETTGSGVDLVLVHGMPMWGALWQERGYVDLLAPHFRVTTVDVLGHGESDKPANPEAYGFPNLATDVVALIDAIGATQAHLWGYSMGAWICEATTVLFPNRVRSLTFGGNVVALSDELKAMVGDPLVASADTGDWDKILVPGLPEESRTEYMRMNDLAAISAAASQFKEWGCTPEELKAVGVPVVAYAGHKEWFLDIAATNAAAVGARFSTVPGDHRVAFASAKNAVGAVLPYLMTPANQ